MTFYYSPDVYVCEPRNYVSSSPETEPIIPDNRGVFGGGRAGSSYRNSIEYISISTLGNADYFGDLTVQRGQLSATSNGINKRGVFGGGYLNPSYTYSNTIDYITISTLEDASDFGDLTIARGKLSATSNGINDRGVFAGGYYHDNSTGYSYDFNIIEYITISSTGDTIDFGDLSVKKYGLGSTSNGINDRGIFAGGGSWPLFNTIEYITIKTSSNSDDFADLTIENIFMTATSNGENERGVFAGGGGTYGYPLINVIEFITISNLEDATDFGDLSVEKNKISSTSNGINDRGVFAGGYKSSYNYSNAIDYISISSICDTTEFGELDDRKYGLAATSDA